MGIGGRGTGGTGPTIISPRPCYTGPSLAPGARRSPSCPRPSPRTSSASSATSRTATRSSSSTTSRRCEAGAWVRARKHVSFDEPFFETVRRRTAVDAVDADRRGARAGRRRAVPVFRPVEAGRRVDHLPRRHRPHAVRAPRLRRRDAVLECRIDRTLRGVVHVGAARRSTANWCRDAAHRRDPRRREPAPAGSEPRQRAARKSPTIGHSASRMRERKKPKCPTARQAQSTRVDASLVDPAVTEQGRHPRRRLRRSRTDRRRSTRRGRRRGTRRGARPPPRSARRPAIRRPLQVPPGIRSAPARPVARDAGRQVLGQAEASSGKVAEGARSPPASRDARGRTSAGGRAARSRANSRCACRPAPAGRSRSPPGASPVTNPPTLWPSDREPRRRISRRQASSMAAQSLLPQVSTVASKPRRRAGRERPMPR